MSASKPQRSAAVVENYPALNSSFYAEEPWRYFERRLLYLAAIAEDPAEAMKDKSFTIGPLKIEMTSSPGIEPTYPTPAQTFIAIESEVLLHHAAETVLRLLYAHVGDDPCPVMRISELRGFAPFKQWVSGLTASNTELEATVRSTFPGPLSDPALASLCHWLGLLGRHFLDSAPYNAAKHGMTLAGGAEQRTLELDGMQLSNAKGASVNWLELWSPDKTPRRWTQASRLLSVEAFLAMIHVTTLLMQGIWARGRRARLPDVYPEASGAPVIPTPKETFELLGVDWYILSRWFDPLVADGEPHLIHMQMPVEEALRVIAGETGTMTRTTGAPPEGRVDDHCEAEGPAA